MKKLLSIGTFVLLVCSVVIVAAALTPQAPPVTQILTDRNLTAYDAEKPEFALGPSALHVIWPEYTVFSPGTNTGDMDLFYAALPGSNTQRIRDTDATTPSGQGITQLGPYDVAVGSNGQVYMAWIEPTATYGSDAFFWKTGMTSPQNISNHALTGTGAAATLFLTLDNNNVPHVLWVERETSYYSVFYWKEGSTTTKLSIETPPVAHLNATRALALISQNGVTHAFWRDLSATTSFGLYYWNSNTQTAVNIRSGQPNLSDPPSAEQAFVSPNGTFHAVWNEFFSSPPYKIAHWDSATATHHTILSQSNTFYFLTPVMDNSGTLHVIDYVSNGPLNYWNSQTLTNQLITANVGSQVPGFVAGKGNIPLYVAWRATDSNYPGHMNDLFYWRPGMAQPQNITDHSQPPSDIVYPGYLVLAAADDGSVHIAWEEGVPTYYHSGSNSTTTLNNSWTVQYDSIGSDSRPLDTPYIGYQGVIFRVYNNTAYWFLASTSTNTATPYTIWRSNNNYTPIPAVYGTDNPVAHGQRLLWFDRSGNPQVAWPGSTPGEQSNVHYWNSEDGSVDVSDSHNTSTSVTNSGMIGATDSINRVYLLWRESDDGPEYLDVFAAVKEPVFNNSLYIPLMQR